MRTRPIGNKAEAYDAVKGNLDYIGEGTFRKVYVNKSRTVVYKVCSDFLTCGDECNWEEAEAYWKLRDLGFKRIARPYTWMVRFGGHILRVNAMRYYNGPRDLTKVTEFAKMMSAYVADSDYFPASGYPNVQCDKKGRPIVVDLQFVDLAGQGRLIMFV